MFVTWTVSSTKSKIIIQAKQLFNKHGFGSISLFEIANELGMSRGNLTYHFKDKDALLFSIAEEMWSKIKAEREKSILLPSFKNLHNEVQLYYKYQKEYGFIFLDPHVLNHPQVKKQFRQMTKQSIMYNKHIIAFSLEVGNMKPEPFPGMYNNLSQIAWMLTFFWLPQQIIRGEKTQTDGEKLIWSVLIPHLTKKGIDNFKKFFGQQYLDSLGQPFEMDIESIISF